MVVKFADTQRDKERKKGGNIQTPMSSLASMNLADILNQTQRLAHANNNINLNGSQSSVANSLSHFGAHNHNYNPSSNINNVFGTIFNTTSPAPTQTPQPPATPHNNPLAMLLNNSNSSANQGMLANVQQSAAQNYQTNVNLAAQTLHNLTQQLTTNNNIDQNIGAKLNQAQQQLNNSKNAPDSNQNQLVLLLQLINEIKNNMSDTKKDSTDLDNNFMDW